MLPKVFSSKTFNKKGIPRTCGLFRKNIVIYVILLLSIVIYYILEMQYYIVMNRYLHVLKGNIQSLSCAIFSSQYM